MPKLAFSQAQQLDLTKRLQLLLLDAMVASGSWADARFQGGTSLCLVYGSSRFSEDLDFVIGTDKGLGRMLSGAAARMTNTLRTALPGAQVKFSSRDPDLEAPAARNPRTFTMTVSHVDWYRAVKVKVEFWLAEPEVVARYESGVRTAQLLSAAVEGGPLRLALPPVLVPTATLQEILVDKVHALACRPYMKHRDVFDLWWLAQQGVADWHTLVVDRYPNHARMYADSPSLEQLQAVLATKAEAVAAMAGTGDFSDELKKWLGEDASLASRASADFIATQVALRLGAMLAGLQSKPEPEPVAKSRQRKKPKP